MYLAMVFRNKLIQVIENKVSDGQGGFKKDAAAASKREINCKASLNTSPEVMNAYGQHGEQVLYVITLSPLDKEAFYLFLDKKYTIRNQTDNGRLYYSTLIEVK